MLTPYYETELGKLYNGDCLEVMRELGDNSVDCCITSPPYNKSYYKKRMVWKGDTWKKAKIEYDGFMDDLTPERYNKQQINVLSELVKIIKPEGSIFYNHKSFNADHKLIFPEYIFKFNLRQIITWDRGSSPCLAPIRFYPTTEYIFWITKINTQPNFQNKNLLYDKDIWRITPKVYTEHPAPFPIQIPTNCILATTNKGDIILDPFLGSGTTALACENLNRKWIGIELSKDYCEIAKKRLIENNREAKLF
ncbi:MAG: DNA-methyltransferase [Thermoplasmataceae archaeon]